MTDYRDMEHDTIADAPTVVGRAPELGPEPTDKHLDREDMREALAERRAAEKVEIPADRKAMLAARYQIRKDDPTIEAEQVEWLSFDNPEIWTAVRTR